MNSDNQQKCDCGNQANPKFPSPFPICSVCYQQQVDLVKQYKDARTEFFPSINKIEEYLYLGNEDTALDKELLQKHNIKHILVTGSHLSQKFPNEYNYLQFDIDDWQKQNIKQHFEAGLKFIHAARSKKENVYIHCAAGVSRSASFTIAYLMVLNSWGYDDTYKYVKERRSEIFPNSGFIEQLRELEEQIKDKKVEFKLE